MVKQIWWKLTDTQRLAMIYATGGNSRAIFQNTPLCPLKDCIVQGEKGEGVPWILEHVGVRIPDIFAVKGLILNWLQKV